MGRQPGVVIIVRHGARLDQADQNWRDTAEKPYDSPLTYGGWIQCQTLGTRIAAELNNLDAPNGSTSDENIAAVESASRKRRKVIIHSSPYLRCIQTSIAVSAGLQQYQQPAKAVPRAPARSSLSITTLLQDSADNFQDSSFRKPLNSTYSQNRNESTGNKLRIDQYLGEWLSPSYFEHSQAPPPSSDLVAFAKSYLKEPAVEIKGADLASPTIYEFSSINWEDKENEVGSMPTYEKTGLRAMAAVGHSMAKRPRNISFGTDVSAPPRSTPKTAKKPIQPVIYNPPIPTYSIAPQDQIPIGYVAHARDACVDTDFSWDSATEPLDWGDGGPYDEEWGAMHRRFRNGLTKMIGYYEAEDSDDYEDNGEELVVVVVTHQAGCNALIRLLTGAPALHDVGTASLTMAVRKKGLTKVASITSVSPTRRRGSLDLGIATEFDMKIIASTEHLRAGSNPLGLNSPRLGKSPAFASRRVVGADSPEGFSIGDPLSSSRPFGLGRSQSQRSFAADDDPGLGAGLWRRGSRYSRDENSETQDSMPSPSLRSIATKDSITEELWGVNGESAIDESKPETNIDTSRLPVRSASQRGLWGGESAIRRDRSPGKRRWTAVDKSP